MRVLHLIKGLGRGGAEMLLPETIRESDPKRFEHGVGYFLPHKDGLVGPLRDQGVDVVCFQASTAAGILARAPEVARFLRTWRADVVHCHLPLAGIAGRLAGRVAGVPVVYSEHNLQEHYARATRVANRSTWRLQEQVVAVSQEVATSIAKNLGGDVPVRVVRNGVSTRRFERDAEAREVVRREHGIAMDAPVVGTVAVFRPQKRLGLWLEVARAVLDRRPDVRFLLVGDGPDRSVIERRIHELGLARSVVLPGLQVDVRPWLSAMDVYLMTSEFEGLPVAMLEAMACELPPVTTAVGGIPEVVRTGVDGFLVAPDARDELVHHVLALVDAPRRRAELGAAARARVHEQFGVPRMVDELEEIYTSVVGR